jgi:hypothetical protein
MKKTVMMRCLMLCLSIFYFQSTMNAQEVKPRGERILQMKRTFMKENLELTEAEEKLFWPLYDTYEAKKKETRKKLRDIQTKVDAENITDDQVKQAIDELQTVKIEEAKNESDFLKGCLPFLGATRVVLLARLEKEFQKEMLELLRNRREERREKMEQRRGGGRN